MVRQCARTVAPFRKADLSLEPTFTPLTGAHAAEDRQHAWELYVEMATRVAVRGNLDGERDSFDEEILTASMTSMAEFFERVRTLVRRYPVGAIGPEHPEHLGFATARMLGVVYGPFLMKWATDLQHWWSEESDRSRPPLERQRQYPNIEAMLSDWSAVREFGRHVITELTRAYGFAEVPGTMPPDLRAAWGGDS